MALKGLIVWNNKLNCSKKISKREPCSVQIIKLKQDSQSLYSEPIYYLNESTHPPETKYFGQSSFACSPEQCLEAPEAVFTILVREEGFWLLILTIFDLWSNKYSLCLYSNYGILTWYIMLSSLFDNFLTQPETRALSEIIDAMQFATDRERLF